MGITPSWHKEAKSGVRGHVRAAERAPEGNDRQTDRHVDSHVLSMIIIMCCAGGLHFANVEVEDEREGLHYVCVVHNTVLRNLVQGDDQIIRPHFVRGLSFTPVRSLELRTSCFLAE